MLIWLWSEDSYGDSYSLEIVTVWIQQTDSSKGVTTALKNCWPCVFHETNIVRGQNTTITTFLLRISLAEFLFRSHPQVLYTLQFFLQLVSQRHFYKRSDITKQVVLRVLH